MKEGREAGFVGKGTNCRMLGDGGAVWGTVPWREIGRAREAGRINGGEGNPREGLGYLRGTILIPAARFL